MREGINERGHACDSVYDYLLGLFDYLLVLSWHAIGSYAAIAPEEKIGR